MPASVRGVAVVTGVCLVTLLVGYALKAQCLGPWDGRQFSHLCYNDIQPLYYARFVASTFPYIHGTLQNGELHHGAIEYPVLTGVFMYASAHLGSVMPFLLRADASSGNEYLYESALLLAPFGLLIAVLLFAMARQRALLWAGAPALALYAFHNWDLLVVAAAVAGFWCWHRQRAGWAAFWFGIGGALKIYPFIFLGPLILERLVARDLKGAGKVFVMGVGPPVLLNAPFALINSSGWFATYAFHATRWADYNSIWAWFVGARFAGVTMPGFGVDTLNKVTAVLTGVFMIAALVLGWLRARKQGHYPVVQVSAAMLAAFLLWNKVHSPQYALWILPFFVLLDLSVWWWIAYAVADLSVYVGIFRWFYDFVYGGMDATWAKRLLIAGVWSRAALLLVLFAVFLHARMAHGVRGRLPEPLSRLPSHPLANFAKVGQHVPAKS